MTAMGVTPAVEAFEEDGYAVLEAFLEGGVVELLRPEVDAALAAPALPGCDRPHNRLVPLTWASTALNLILDAEERRRAVAATIGADDLRSISAYVSTKEPHTPPLWWHQDWWCWDHPVSFRPTAPQVAVLCYTSATTYEMGALRVIPGSQRASLPLHELLVDGHANGLDLPAHHAAFNDHPSQVTLEVGAGDAVVMDYRLLHATHGNASAKRRDCLLLSFAPSWGTLPADVRGHLIRHLAQPEDDEAVGARQWRFELLPTFDGPRADLPINRVAPAHFTLSP